jgi:hypothetical protein
MQLPESLDMWSFFNDEGLLTDDELTSGITTQDTNEQSPLSANEVAWLQHAAAVDWDEVREARRGSASGSILGGQPCALVSIIAPRPVHTTSPPLPPCGRQELEKELQSTVKSSRERRACDEAVLARLFDHRVVLLEPPCPVVKGFFSNGGERHPFSQLNEEPFLAGPTRSCSVSPHSLIKTPCCRCSTTSFVLSGQ